MRSRESGIPPTAKQRTKRLSRNICPKIDCLSKYSNVVLLNVQKLTKCLKESLHARMTKRAFLKSFVPSWYQTLTSFLDYRAVNVVTICASSFIQRISEWENFSDQSQMFSNLDIS